MNDSALAAKTQAPVESVDVSVYTVPTDGPEADGTLTWDHTTMVLVEARAQGVTGLGWTYGSPATAQVITGELNEVVLGHGFEQQASPFAVGERAFRSGVVRARPFRPNVVAFCGGFRSTGRGQIV